MQGGRKITAMLRGGTLEGSVAKGCPQRGILLHHSCEEWLQTKSYRGSAIAVINWDMCYLHQWKIPKKMSLHEALSVEQQCRGNTQISIHPQNVQHINILWNKNTMTKSVSRILRVCSKCGAAKCVNIKNAKKIKYVQSAWVTTVPDFLVFCWILWLY